MVKWRNYSAPVEKALNYYDACQRFSKKQILNRNTVLVLVFPVFSVFPFFRFFVWPFSIALLEPDSVESLADLKSVVTEVVAHRFPLIAANWNETNFDKQAALVNFFSSVPGNGLISVKTVKNDNRFEPSLINLGVPWSQNVEANEIFPENKKPTQTVFRLTNKRTQLKNILRRLKDEKVNENEWDVDFKAFDHFEKRLEEAGFGANFASEYKLDNFLKVYNNFDWRTLLRGVYGKAGVQLTDDDRVHVASSNYVRKLGDLLNQIDDR